ncbi:serine/threonine protein phosphatase [Floricoccus tropicus]|uniref:Serine/threonine protein phosphatase n=1 Tax=Floricoccus tropicus TaxID=1859473 RepID=A0A1E8GP36_9LACT|nr:metallophosphoesterase family protein [Floricoccus tropicus]OFI50034.1 serine/threonine protein phosphatase [Floricoccus tropicus]
MNHKIGIISDIHGNFTALKAVIEDAKKSGVTEYWLLGDIVLPGPGANELFDYLSTLPITVKVRGNWDDCFLEAIGKENSLESPSDVYITRLSQYLKENLDEKYIDELRSTPLYIEKEVNGIKILISHNLPNQNWGRGLLATNSTEDFDKLFTDSDYDMAIYGHIHTQLIRYSSKMQIILNPGTVGQPFSMWKKFEKDLRAQYAILEFDDFGLGSIQLKKVLFNIEEELELAKKENLPYLDLYEEQLKTGVVHTHDEELLEKINLKEGYIADLKEYFNF